MSGLLPALIPVNRLDRAKGRLAELLTAAERRQLALATLHTVLAATREAQMLPLVLTSDESLAAELPGVKVLPEAVALAGLNAAIEGALLRVQALVPQASDPRLLILHADLPLATGSAIRAVIAAAPPPPAATLVRSADGGTNAMFLRPPGLFPFAYGPGSHAAHVARARAAGMAVVTIAEPSLELDLDTPADILALLASDTGRASAAGRLLASWGIERRLGV
jgi:2-phospho-L-lactate guanylyltransferase